MEAEPGAPRTGMVVVLPHPEPPMQGPRKAGTWTGTSRTHPEPEEKSRDDQRVTGRVRGQGQGPAASETKNPMHQSRAGHNLWVLA